MKGIIDKNRTKVIFLLRKNRTALVWSVVSTFENNPATQTILEGFSVPGLTLTELEQIKNMGKGVNLLAELLTSEEFDFDQDIACKIHNAVGLEEAIALSKLLRPGAVRIEPEASALKPPARRFAERLSGQSRVIIAPHDPP